jgi:Glycosyltransferase like family 2
MTAEALVEPPWGWGQDRRLTVVVTTRGRPRQVVGLIEAALMLARKPDDVHFVVACDSDDITAAFLEARGYGIDPHVTINVAPRPTTVTMVTNRACATVKTPYLLILGDDGVIATAEWDHMVTHYLASIVEPELRICALNDMANPGQPTLFALHHAWLDATQDQPGGCPFDTRFPFWWSDSAIGETYSFVTGSIMPILNVVVASKPGDWNPRLRDMSLWWDFYGATRGERLQTATHVRSRFGLSEPANLDHILNVWRKRDAGGLPASQEIVRLIESQGRAVPADDNYIAAKAAAEAYLG